MTCSEQAGTRELDASTARLVLEEADLVSKLVSVIGEAAGLTTPAMNFRQELVNLREEAEDAKEDEFSSVLYQYNLVRTRAENKQSILLPNLSNPCFAHMRIRSKGRERDIFLGERSFMDREHGICIVDWRTAPIASVFYNYSRGEDFEEELSGREVLEGTLLRKIILGINRGRLVSLVIDGSSVVLVDGKWLDMGLALDSSIITPEKPVCERDYDISSLLDEHQRKIVSSEFGNTLLVLGSAGSGKTTVALHRLAGFSQQCAGQKRNVRLLYLAPEKGIVKLSGLTLDALVVKDAERSTFDAWFALQCERLFEEKPARINDDAPTSVAKLKRHPAMKKLIADYAEHYNSCLVARLCRRFRICEQAEEPAYLRETCLASLDDIQKVVLGRLSVEVAREGAGAKDELLSARECLAAERKRLFDIKADWIELMRGDFWIRQLMDLSSGSINEETVTEVIKRTNYQLEPPAGRKYDGYDAESLKTVDGKELDDGTPYDLSGTIDNEDCPVILEILRQKTGVLLTPRTKVRHYSHVVIDEAQELSDIDLSVLGCAFRSDCGITLAGDDSQQIDASIEFAGWNRISGYFRKGDLATERLGTIYRSSSQISRFASRVLRGRDFVLTDRTVHDGPEVVTMGFSSEGHCALSIMELVRGISSTAARSNTAIIARTPERATALSRVLSKVAPVRLALDGDFEFKPGIDITEVSLVKGLEFDFVIIPDADAQAYPDTPYSRRTLYLASTRAIERLFAFYTGNRSPILD